MMIKRYEIQIDNEKFVLTKEDNEMDEYNIFLVTDKGLSQSENDFTNKTQDYINHILNNINKYTTSENEITNPNYTY